MRRANNQSAREGVIRNNAVSRFLDTCVFGKTDRRSDEIHVDVVWEIVYSDEIV